MLIRNLVSPCVVLTVLLAVTSIQAQTKSFNFVVSRSAEKGPTHYAIQISFTGEDDGTTKINLPTEWGGQADLHKAIRNLRVTTPGAALADTDKSHVKTITHKPLEKLTIEYDLAQDFQGPLTNKFRYRPVTEKDYVHWIGYTTWVLPAWSELERVDATFEWRGLPDSWAVANSFGVSKRKQSFTTFLGGLQRSITVAGDFRITSTQAGGKPVHVAIRGKWDFADGDLAEMVRKVIETERVFWKDLGQPYYLVTLVPIEEGPNSFSFGGTGMENSFALFATPNAKVDRLRGLLAHEYFHNWNPVKLGKMPDPEQQMYWFSEGFTEYYTYRLLHRGGLISEDEYIAQFNDLVREYYVLPVRNEPNERIVKDFWNDPGVQRLPYLRGLLLAANLDAAIRRASANKYSLDDVMHGLFANANGGTREITSAVVAETVQRYLGSNPTGDLKRFMIDGELITPDANALGPNFELEVKQIPVFELGIDVDVLLSAKTIAKVKPGSAAYNAGLRDGQKVVGGISIYFGNTDREIELKIKDTSGERSLKFLPIAPDRISVPQFRRKH